LAYGERMPTGPHTHEPKGGKTLVVGAGFIGSGIPRQVGLRGCTVAVVTRTPLADHRCSLPSGTEVVIGDICEPEVLERVTDGVDRVIVSIGGLMPAVAEVNRELNEQLTLNPLGALFRSFRGRTLASLTLISSGGTVYGPSRLLPTPEDGATNPISAYGKTRRDAEMRALEFGQTNSTSVRIVRVSNAYGPGQDPSRGQGIIGAALECVRRRIPLVVYGDGTASRDFVHVDDVARVVAELALLPEAPSIINLGGGVSSSILEVIDVVRDVTKGALAVELAPRRGHDVSDSWLDISLLKSLIDFVPVPLRDGIRSTWDHESIELSRTGR